MIGKFSAIIGAILFAVYLASITYSVLKSSIISASASIPVVVIVVVALGMMFIISASASIPVVVIVVVALGMMFYDFNRMLSLTSKNKKKR